MNVNKDQLQFKFKFQDNDDFPAGLTLVIGQFEIRGFTIRKTKFSSNVKRYALFPPAKGLGGGKWLHLFRAPDKKDWQELEDIVLEQFDKEHSDYLMTNLKIKTSPDEIKF